MGHDGIVSGWLPVTYTFEKKGLVERDDFTAGSHVMISVKGEPTPPAKAFARDLMVGGWRGCVNDGRLTKPEMSGPKRIVYENTGWIGIWYMGATDCLYKLYSAFNLHIRFQDEGENSAF